jgi:putative two-component system response regulator
MDDLKARVLIVDDEQNNRELLEVMLEPEDYRIRSVSNGKDAIEMIKKQPPDLILLDIMMAGMNGFEVALKLKADPDTRNIPIIMLTSLTDKESRLKGLNSGAEEFITKPFDRTELCVRVKNMLKLKEYNDLLDKYNKTLETDVKKRTKELEESQIESIFTLTKAAEYKDKDTGAHVRRISYYCKYLAQSMGQDSVFIDNIFYASPMHDIGKIGISDHILLKPGKHTKDEFEIMQSHSRLGAEILNNTKSPYLQMGSEIAMQHHEKFDGTGYPDGISGAAISLPARIMSICDVYDALRSKRPYKQTMAHEETVNIITKGDGRTMPHHFDPVVLQTFLASESYFKKIYQELTPEN